MKILKRIGVFLLVLILLLLVISFFLPSKVHVERSATINADPTVVFNEVNNLKNWEQWSPWYKMDPNMKIVYSGPNSGVGAAYNWQSDNKNLGSGKLTIIESHPYDHVAMTMDFMQNGVATGDFKFEKTDDGTKVTWGMDSDMGWSPMGKFFGLFMDQFVGSDFEKGLQDLAVVSRNAQPGGGPQINPMPSDTTKKDSSMKM